MNIFDAIDAAPAWVSFAIILGFYAIVMLGIDWHRSR